MFSELVESVVVEPGDVVVIQMESDELVEGSESSAGYTGHLVPRHGEGLKLCCAGERERVNINYISCPALTI